MTFSFDFCEYETFIDLFAEIQIMSPNNYRGCPHNEECVEGIVEGFVPNNCPNFGTIQQRGGQPNCDYEAHKSFFISRQKCCEIVHFIL
jgi:hypothetical protein